MNRLIRILVATLTGLGVLFGVAAIGAPAAVAANTKYVTPAEYRKVRFDMPIKKVHRIFGTNGKQTGHSRWSQTRVYLAKAPEGGWSRVRVKYVKSNGIWKVKHWPDAVTADWYSWYVTNEEWNKFDVDMPMEKVHRIFDTPGKQTYYDGGEPGWPGPYQIRMYPYGQSANKVVLVHYVKVNGTWKVWNWDSPYKQKNVNFETWWRWGLIPANLINY